MSLTVYSNMDGRWSFDKRVYPPVPLHDGSFAIIPNLYDLTIIISRDFGSENG